MAGPNMVFLGTTLGATSLMTVELTSHRHPIDIPTDFTISAMGAEPKLRCHKSRLSTHSAYFEAMFRMDMVETKLNTVNLANISLETMKIILDYCYYEQVSFPDDQLIPLITACDFLQIEHLKQRCANEVKTFLNPENVLQYLAFAGQQDLKHVKSWCMEMIVKRFLEVYEQETFLAFTYAELQEYLTKTLCYVKLGHILYAVLRWIGDDAAERAKYLDELLQQVQMHKFSLLALLDAKETCKAIIAANPKVSSLLSKSISNKQLVIVGGHVNVQVSPECWSLNKKEYKFVKVCSIPFEELAKFHSVCEIPDGFSLTGGRDSDLCVVFEASTRSWKRMNMLRKRHHHASVFIKGKLYVLCGSVSGMISESVDCLTLESGQWESLINSPVAINFPKVAELDGKLYMLDAHKTRRLLQFDVEKNVWKVLKSFPGRLDYSACMIAVNGQLCVAGGTGAYKVCAWYRPTSSTWFMWQQKPIQNHFYGSLVQKDSTTLMLLGGDDIEELNIADRSWSLSSVKMPVNRSFHTAMYLNIPQD